MQITVSEYDEFFKGYQIYDCAVRSRNAFSFVVLESRDDNSEPEKVLINYFPHDPPGERLGGRIYTGFQFPKLAVSRKPKEQAIMVGMSGGVAVLGGGDDDMENSIPKGGPDQPLYTSAHALATIDGYVYAAGPWRAVCRRTGPNQWESLADRTTLPVPKRNSSGSNDEGFDAIDGFHANDIYCAGGHGDVWRFDGKRWHQCPVPTNMTIENVCCAGDGYVYVGMRSGSVMRGRENTWKVIHQGNFTLPFKDMVWFDGRVWCTSDYGIWTIEDGKLVEPELPVEVRACAGNLSVGDGVMLLAGMYGAIVYDGKEWHKIIDINALA